MLGVDADNQVYILKVDEAQAEQIAHVQSTGASFTIGLRPPGDDRSFDPGPYGQTTNNMIDIFGFKNSERDHRLKSGATSQLRAFSEPVRDSLKSPELATARRTGQRLPIPLRFSMMRINAGPRMTMNIAGKMHPTRGKSILIGARAAASSAR